MWVEGNYDVGSRSHVWYREKAGTGVGGVGGK